MEKGQRVGLHVPPGGNIKPKLGKVLALVSGPAAEVRGPQGKVVLHSPCSFPLEHLVTLQNRILHSTGPRWQLEQLGLWTEREKKLFWVLFHNCWVLLRFFPTYHHPSQTPQWPHWQRSGVALKAARGGN